MSPENGNPVTQADIDTYASSLGSEPMNVRKYGGHTAVGDMAESKRGSVLKQYIQELKSEKTAAKRDVRTDLEKSKSGGQFNTQRERIQAIRDWEQQTAKADADIANLEGRIQQMSMAAEKSTNDTAKQAMEKTVSRMEEDLAMLKAERLAFGEAVDIFSSFEDDIQAVQDSIEAKHRETVRLQEMMVQMERALSEMKTERQGAVAAVESASEQYADVDQRLEQALLESTSIAETQKLIKSLTGELEAARNRLGEAKLNLKNLEGDIEFTANKLNEDTEKLVKNMQTESEKRIREAREQLGLPDPRPLDARVTATAEKPESVVEATDIQPQRTEFSGEAMSLPDIDKLPAVDETPGPDLSQLQELAGETNYSASGNQLDDLNAIPVNPNTENITLDESQTNEVVPDARIEPNQVIPQDSGEQNPGQGGGDNNKLTTEPVVEAQVDKTGIVGVEPAALDILRAYFASDAIPVWQNFNIAMSSEGKRPNATELTDYMTANRMEQKSGESGPAFLRRVYNEMNAKFRMPSGVELRFGKSSEEKKADLVARRKAIKEELEQLNNGSHPDFYRDGKLVDSITMGEIRSRLRRPLEAEMAKINAEVPGDGTEVTANETQPRQGAREYIKNFYKGFKDRLGGGLNKIQEGFQQRAAQRASEQAQRQEAQDELGRRLDQINAYNDRLRTLSGRGELGTAASIDALLNAYRTLFDIAALNSDGRQKYEAIIGRNTEEIPVIEYGADGKLSLVMSDLTMGTDLNTMRDNLGRSLRNIRKHSKETPGLAAGQAGLDNVLARSSQPLEERFGKEIADILNAL